MNKVDMLCERINKRFGLGNRQIGSIERYTNAATNSVVQIGNEYGGHTTLITGTDNQLISYLESVLDGKFKFYDSLIRRI